MAEFEEEFPKFLFFDEDAFWQPRQARVSVDKSYIYGRRGIGKSSLINYSNYLQDFTLRKQEQLNQTVQDMLVADSLGIDRDSFPMYRYFPVEIYLGGGEEAESVLSELIPFLSAFEFEIIDAEDTEYGSWFKRLLAKTIFKKTKNELEDGFDKTKKALELKHIDKVQSEIDLNQANAAAALLGALDKDSKSTAVKVGNVLILTHTLENGEKHQVVQTLSKEQLEMLHANQALLKSPDNLLENLSVAS